MLTLDAEWSIGIGTVSVTNSSVCFLLIDKHNFSVCILLGPVLKRAGKKTF